MATQPYNQAKAEMPTTMLVNDMRNLHNEMADLIIMFNALCERLEKCAVSLREMNLVNNREMFQAFFDRGIIPGKLVRFVDNPIKDAIYEITGMDGEGFFIKRFPCGIEKKLRVMEEYNRCKAMRIIKEDTFAVKRALSESGRTEEELPSRKKAQRLSHNPSMIPEYESYFEHVNEEDNYKMKQNEDEFEMNEIDNMTDEKMAQEMQDYDCNAENN